MFRKLISYAALTAALALGAANAEAGSSRNGVVLVPASYSETLAAPRAGVTLYDFASPAQSTDGDFARAQIVDYAGPAANGSIVVDTREHRLYLILGNGKAASYRVATAKPGFEWQGTHTVASKTEWPDWRPPVEMRGRRPELPEFMSGGPKNPLGARAIYIGGTIYRIHGTNEPKSIGKSASSGCIRMFNADVIELYSHVKLGVTVTVI